MRFYKQLKDGYIVAVGTGGGYIEITETEYNEIRSMLRTRPIREGFGYRLKADLTWEEYEKPVIPPMPEEITAEEALDIIMGGADE